MSAPQTKKHVLLLDTNTLLSLVGKSQPEELVPGEEFSAFDRERQRSGVMPHRLRSAVARALVSDDCELRTTIEVRDELNAIISIKAEKGELSEDNIAHLRALSNIVSGVVAHTDQKRMTLGQLAVHNMRISQIDGLTKGVNRYKKFRDKLENSSKNPFRYPKHNVSIAFRSKEETAELEERRAAIPLCLAKNISAKDRRSLHEELREIENKLTPKVWTDLALIQKAEDLVKSAEGYRCSIITADADLGVIQDLCFKDPAVHINCPESGATPISIEETLDILKKGAKRGSKGDSPTLP